MNWIMCTHRRSPRREESNTKNAFLCQWCGEMGYGTFSVCDNQCKCQVHLECLTAFHVDDFFSFFGSEPFFLECRLRSANDEGDLGTACGISTNGLVYICTPEIGRNIYLHPCCMNLPLSIDADDGERLTLKKKLEVLNCQYCKQTTLGTHVDGWGYVSDDQTSACHIKCMKDNLYEEWIFSEQVKELPKDQPWWLVNAYVDLTEDDNFVPSIGSSSGSSSSSLSGPESSRQGQKQNIDLALTTTTTNLPRPTGRKCRMLLSFAKVAGKLFIHVAVIAAGGAIAA